MRIHNYYLNTKLLKWIEIICENHIRTMGERFKGKFIDTTFPVVKREPEKFRFVRDSNPLTL